MNARQLAIAAVNDRGTQTARAAALARFLNGADRHIAVSMLMPVVAAEFRKPIYEGVDPWPGLFWEAAYEMLDFEIGLAIAEGGTD
jgi:hypothetical protein